MLTATAGTVEVAWWKRYRGGTATKLWLDRHGDGEFERLFADERAPLESPLWLDGGATIGFVSDRDGSSELWAAALPADGCPVAADLRRLTDHRLLRPPRHVRRPSRRVPERRRDLAVGRRRRRSDRHRPRRRADGRRCPSRSTPATHLGAIAPGGRRPGQRRRGARHGVVADPPRRPGARPGRRGRRCAGGFRSWSTPAGDVAWVTDANGDDAIELWSAADETSADGRRRRDRPRARAGRRPGRFAAGRRQPRRPAVGGDRRHRRAARGRSHRQRRHHRAWRSRPTRAGWPGRIPGRSRSPRSASPRSPSRQRRRST